MPNTNYLNLLAEAHAFTVHNLHGETAFQNTDLHLDKYGDAKMQVAYKFIQDMLSMVDPSHIVDKCFFICLGANDLLLQNGFRPILTTGYTLVNYKEKEYYTDRDELVGRFTNLIRPIACDFHVWLTVGDYIIDPTYMTSAHYHRFKSYPKNKSIIYHKHEELPLRIWDCPIDYVPQITGARLYNPILPPHLWKDY